MDEDVWMKMCGLHFITGHALVLTYPACGPAQSCQTTIPDVVQQFKYTEVCQYQFDWSLCALVHTHAAHNKRTGFCIHVWLFVYICWCVCEQTCP